MEPFPRRLALLGAAAVAVPLLAALPIGTAQAAVTHTVVVTANGFSPNPQPALTGDSIRIRNDANVDIRLTYGSNWPGARNEVVASGRFSGVRMLDKAGTYLVSATDALTGQLFKVSGTVKVTAPAPGPTPKPSSTRVSTAPSPAPSATQAPTSAPAQPTPSSGTAPGPAIGPTFSAGPQPTAGGGPQPSVAPPPSNDVPVLAGGSKTALLQPHPVRRLGLPGALSAVLVLGLLFGIARVLLAMAPRRPQSG